MPKKYLKEREIKEENKVVAMCSPEILK